MKQFDNIDDLLKSVVNILDNESSRYLEPNLRLDCEGALEYLISEKLLINGTYFDGVYFPHPDETDKSYFFYLVNHRRGYTSAEISFNSFNASNPSLDVNMLWISQERMHHIFELHGEEIPP